MTVSKTTASPEPVALAVHDMPVPDLDSQRRTVAGRWKMLAVLAMCAAPVVASYFTYFVIRPEGRTNYGTLVAPPRELPPALGLTDLQGRAVAPESLRGQWLLVVAAPASCEAVCETHLLHQRQIREAIGREKDRLDKVWFVTDAGPVREPLRAALAATPPVQALRVDGPVLARWLEPAPGQAIADHLYLVDPMGNFMLRWPARAEPARVKRDLERLLRASAFWDQPGRAAAAEAASPR